LPRRAIQIFLESVLFAHAASMPGVRIFDRDEDVSGLLSAAALRSVPLTVVDVDTEAPVYEEKLVLSRPDQHVAWRGNKAPGDPLELIDRVRGAIPRPE
jgi:hypothetical protein